MSNFNFFGGISAFLLVVCTFCLFFNTRTTLKRSHTLQLHSNIRSIPFYIRIQTLMTCFRTFTGPA